LELNTNLKEKAISGVKWTTLASISNVVIQFLRIAILARILEKSDFGLMALVMLVMGFMDLFADMGISVAILHKQKISEKEYSSLYWFNWMMSFALLFIIWIVANIVSSFYQEPQLKFLIPLMGLNLIFTALGRQYATIAQKNLHFRFISLTEIVTSILSLIPAIILALNNFGVYSLIYSALFAGFCSNLCYYLKMKNIHKISLHYKFSETKSFLKIGIYNIGGQILTYFTDQFDVILIGKILGLDLLGIYNLAKNLAMRPAQITNPIITKISIPVFAKIQNDTGTLRNSYLKIVRLLSVINFPVYFFIAILSAPIIKIVYGTDNSSMIYVLSILSMYYMFRFIISPMGGLLIAKGRTDIGFYWNIGITVAVPVFIYIGCQYSLIGAAIAHLLIIILAYIPSWFFIITKMINVSFGKYAMQSLPYFSYSGIASILTFVFLHFFVFPGIISILVGFLLFGGIYMLNIFIFDKQTCQFVLRDLMKHIFPVKYIGNKHSL
jgi:PST family polysaccharide transporter/teichuronic acid exporter